MTEQARPERTQELIQLDIDIAQRVQQLDPESIVTLLAGRGSDLVRAANNNNNNNHG